MSEPNCPLIVWRVEAFLNKNDWKYELTHTFGLIEMNRIVLADNMAVLPTIEPGTANLIYIDPPFNTGKAVQQREHVCEPCATTRAATAPASRAGATAR